MSPPADSAPSITDLRGTWGLSSPGLGISLGGTHGVDQAAVHRRWLDRAEALGLHSIWLPEMHFSRGVCPAPLVELAGFAARTKRIRLGTTSLLLPLHPPLAIAAEIAALDQLSEGRMLVGLGRGFQKPMLKAFGVPPAEKRDRFDDALDRILGVWREARAASQSGAPVQNPHPPLAVAAFGPKGLAQASRRGLPYLASPVETFDQIADNQERHRAGLPESSPGTLSLVMRTVFVSENESEIETARAALIAEMQGRRAGMPAAVDQALDSPLDDRAVIGSAEAVTKRLVQERNRLGIDLLVVRPQIRGLSESAVESSLTTLAEKVWPTVSAANA